MQIFEIVVALLLGGAALTALSRRIGVPYPAMIALAGAAIALVPGTPTLELDPELALTLFVAPVLLDAAFDASLRDLRAQWRAVAGLAIGAVAFTIGAVAVVVHALVPTMPWAVAVALGAIVAPPDAAAATAVLKQLRPPHRLLVILEGESLFNDASALLVFRLAVGAATAGSLSVASVVPTFLFVTVGSLVLGLALAPVVIWLSSRIEDIAIGVVVQFGATFGIWMLAERLHLSGILTVVVFAMAVARRAAGVLPARARLPSFAVWELAVFVLNVLAFALVGLQLEAIVGRLDPATLVAYLGIAAAVCVATMAARIAWVGVASAVARRALGNDPRSVSLSRDASVVAGWCGMRGIVTLAAALALPEAFPHRDLLLFCSFSVVLVTLVVQGMTLRPLISYLKLADDGSVDREITLARVATFRAATGALADQQGEVAALLRDRYALMLGRAESPPPAPSSEASLGLEKGERAVRAVVAAQRDVLVALRADGTIGDAAFQRVEQELDLEELDLGRLTPNTTE